MKIKGTKKAFRLGVRQHRLVLDYVTALQDLMNQAALNQQQLADALGKSRAWISKIFRRKPNLTFFTAVELADAVGCDVEIVLTPRMAMTARLSAPTFENLAEMPSLSLESPQPSEASQHPATLMNFAPQALIEVADHYYDVSAEAA